MIKTMENKTEELALLAQTPPTLHQWMKKQVHTMYICMWAWRGREIYIYYIFFIFVLKYLQILLRWLAVYLRAVIVWSQHVGLSLSLWRSSVPTSPAVQWTHARNYRHWSTSHRKCDIVIAQNFMIWLELIHPPKKWYFLHHKKLVLNLCGYFLSAQ
jgi:hypothetical protein